MCCDDGPPDFGQLGPPPKPPWITYQLHCDEGVVLQHEDQSSALPSSGKALFSNSTLNIVAIVLFSLAAVFLIFTIIILWYKRRVIFKKQQVDPRDLPNNLDDDCQYLYNYRVRGKVWKFPRVTMVLRSKSYKHDKKKEKPNGNADSIEKPEMTPTELMIQETLSTRRNSDIGSEVETLTRDRTSQIYMPYSSLDRRSSTTSGISSDGDMRSAQDLYAPYIEEDSPYRVKRLRRKNMTRYMSRQSRDDGDLGDIEGSLESLAQREKRYIKERQMKKEAQPKPSVEQTPRLKARDVRPRRRPEHPSSDVPQNTPSPNIPDLPRQKTNVRTHQETFSPPKENQDESGLLSSRYRSALEPIQFSIDDGVRRGRKKRKRRKYSEGENKDEDFSMENMENRENEIKESYA